MSAAGVTPQALSALKEQREQLWSTIDAILEENAALRADLASRSVALMVPGMDDNADLAPIIMEAQKGLECGRIALNAWIVKHANPIPPSRILKDGEVAVDVDELRLLKAIESRITEEIISWNEELREYVDALDSFRSNHNEKGR